MPRHDTPHRPSRRFPSVSTGVALIRQQPRLSVQLERIFGQGRTLEILFATSLLLNPPNRRQLLGH